MTLIKSVLRNTKFWILAWIVWMGVIFYFSNLPGYPAPSEPTVGLLIERKGAHLVEYLILTLLSAQVFSLLFFKESLRRIVVLAAGWSFAYAALDELHQFFTPYRGAEIRDVAIDLIGVLLGIILIYSLFFLKSKTKKTRR